MVNKKILISVEAIFFDKFNLTPLRFGVTVTVKNEGRFNEDALSVIDIRFINIEVEMIFEAC